MSLAGIARGWSRDATAGASSDPLAVREGAAQHTVPAAHGKPLTCRLPDGTALAAVSI